MLETKPNFGDLSVYNLILIILIKILIIIIDNNNIQQKNS